MSDHRTPVQALNAAYEERAHSAIYFNPAQKCWVSADTRRRLKGIRTTLTNECWPSYDYRQAERLHPTASSVRVKTGIRGGKRPRTAANRGQRRAKLVHEQLAKVAELGYAGMRRYFNNRRKPVHKFVRSLCNEFERQHWKLLASEVPVFNDRFGSAIDLIVLNENTRRLVLLELKVGGDNYHRKCSGRLEGFLAPTDYDNSPLMQAHVQLCAYRVLFERCYSKYITPNMIGACCVVFVGESGVAVYPMDYKKRTALTAPMVDFLYAEPETEPETESSE